LRRRLGSTRAIGVDVRVLAASHVQLQEAVARGDFREDLYYRLAVLPLTVPPLRSCAKPASVEIEVRPRDALTVNEVALLPSTTTVPSLVVRFTETPVSVET